MDLITVFIYTLFIVGIGELGDKTQIATGTNALANKENVRIIFFSSTLALILVAGITVFFAGLIPKEYLEVIKNAGGLLLIFYGLYLLLKGEDEGDSNEVNYQRINKLKLFITNFSIVLIAELGDKTQVTTLAIAIENQTQLFIVFLASVSALTLVTLVTTWGITKIPSQKVIVVQKIGATLMIIYGVYMLF